MIAFRGFRRLMADIVAVLGARYWLYACLMILTGLMEAVSVASVVPLLVAAGVGSSGTADGGRVSRVVLSTLAWFGVAPTVTSIGMFVLAALLISTGLFLAQAYVGAQLETQYAYRWRQRLTGAFFRARWGFFLQRRHGDLINAIVTETQRLSGAFYEAGMLITGVVHGALYLVIAATLSGTITAIILAGGVMLFLVTRPLVHRAYRLGTGITQENAALQSLAGELVGGAKLVKATATEGEAIRLINGTADRLRSHFLANAFDMQLVKGIFDFGAAAMGAGILIASSSLIGSDPVVTLVVLAIFVRLMPKLTGVQYSLQWLTFALPAVEQLQQLATEAEREAESISSAPLPGDLSRGPLAVALRDVDVHHGSVAALAGVTLDIPAGACVALVGASGAGKSTLVDAVLGLVPISSGAIRINGAALETLPLASLRRRIGYVGQETVLYNGTIRDNILWGSGDCTDTDLDAAVRLAGAERFIGKLRDGYDTPVGDAGGLLSGGERQRLGLARAALGKPGVLVLDEATSALDAETERTVTDAVAALKGTTTIIMIAHRLSSVRIADTICVIEDGRIVERGSFDDLIQQQGRLHQLWQLQHEQAQASHVEA